MDQARADTFEILTAEIIALCSDLHGTEYRLIERIRRLEAQARRDAVPVLAERVLVASPTSEEGLNIADRFLVTLHASAEALPEYAEIDPTDSPGFEVRALPRKRAGRD